MASEPLRNVISGQAAVALKKRLNYEREIMQELLATAPLGKIREYQGRLAVVLELLNELEQPDGAAPGRARS